MKPSFRIVLLMGCGRRALPSRRRMARPCINSWRSSIGRISLRLPSTLRKRIERDWHPRRPDCWPGASAALPQRLAIKNKARAGFPAAHRPAVYPESVLTLTIKHTLPLIGRCAACNRCVVGTVKTSCKMGRKSLFDRPMTSTEPARRSLAKKAGVLVEDSGVEEAASNRNDRAEYMRNYQAMRRGLPSDFMKQRPSTEDMEKRHEDLFDIVVEMEPMTVRQVFYQATTRGIVEKSENGYFKVMRALVKMRRSGRLPFAWIVDNSREIHQLRTFASIGAALQDAVDCYRMDYWTNANERVQIWLEKDALASVVEPVVQEYDVPLVVARGFSSWSQLHEAAIEYIEAFDGPTYIYQFGDYDPSGETAAKTIESSLRELAPRSEIHFERIAVTPEQIKPL